MPILLGTISIKKKYGIRYRIDLSNYLGTTS